MRSCTADLAVDPSASAGHVRHHITALAHLAAWASLYYPLERSTVLDHRVIEAFFVHDRERVSVHTAAARKRMLTRIGRALNPDWTGAAKFPRATEAVLRPYADHEIGRVLDWSGSQGTEARRAETEVVLALVLGGACVQWRSSVCGGRDVALTEDGVLVHPHGYRGASPCEVVVRAEWEEPIRDRVSVIDRDEHVSRPGRESDSAQSLTRFLHRPQATELPPPDLRRLRSTWSVRHISAGVPADVLCADSGLCSLNTYANHVARARRERMRVHLSMMRGVPLDSPRLRLV